MNIDHPPVREDGLCLTCGGPRYPERSRRYAKGAADLDPWCSNVCAIAWYSEHRPQEGSASA